MIWFSENRHIERQHFIDNVLTIFNIYSLTDISTNISAVIVTSFKRGFSSGLLRSNWNVCHRELLSVFLSTCGCIRNDNLMACSIFRLPVVVLYLQLLGWKSQWVLNIWLNWTLISKEWKDTPVTQPSLNGILDKLLCNFRLCIHLKYS